MKNIKINENLKIIIITGLSLVLVGSGYKLGKLDSKKDKSPKSNDTTVVNNDELIQNYLDEYFEKHDVVVKEYLDEYIEKHDIVDVELINGYLSASINRRDELEREIATLSKQKEQLQNVEKHHIDNLIVIENTDVTGKTDLYILRTLETAGMCYEYRDCFKAWYGIDEETKKLAGLAEYICFDECQPLFNYLTDKEKEMVENNGGKITTLELDKILGRIRKEYHENKNINKTSQSQNNTSNVDNSSDSSNEYDELAKDSAQDIKYFKTDTLCVGEFAYTNNTPNIYIMALQPGNKIYPFNGYTKIECVLEEYDGLFEANVTLKKGNLLITEPITYKSNPINDLVGYTALDKLMTEEEKTKYVKNGEISNVGLNNILKRLRTEYQDKFGETVESTTEKNKSLKLK